MNPILRAARFAARAHENQKRKYSGRAYIEHPARVAGYVALHPNADETMVVASWLHDVIEDSAITLGEIEREFGSAVAHLVGELTNPSADSQGCRSERKAQDRAHLGSATKAAKIIKLVDRIDNLREMEAAPDRFRRLYSEESLLLADVLGDSDSALKRELIELASRMRR